MTTIRRAAVIPLDALMGPDARIIDDIVRRLVALEQVVADLLQQNRRPSSDLPHSLRARVDPAADARFVATIAATVQGRVFTANELVMHARVDDALAQVLGPLTAGQVGRRLRALMGCDIGGWMVERIGRDADGVLWHVVASALHGGPRVSGEDAV